MNDLIYRVKYSEIINKEQLNNLWKSGFRGLLLESVGFENVDLKEAEKLGFVWDKLNNPYSIDTAENVLVLLSGLWKKLGYRERLNGKNCLVIGSDGHLGKKVCKLAKGLGMVVFDFDIANNNNDGKRLLNWIGEADFIFLCVPVDKKTTNYFSSKQFNAMKNNKPYIVNISGRHALLQPEIVAEQLEKGNISGYACDEKTIHEIGFSPNCYFQKHSGAKTIEGNEAKEKELVLKEQGLLLKIGKRKK